MIKMLLKVVILGLFIGLNAPAFADETENLHQLFGDEWAQRLEDNPLTATYTGAEGYNDKLRSVTPETKKRQMEQDQAFLDRLNAIDRSALSVSDQVNYDLFAYTLESNISLGAFRGWRVPFLADFGFYSEVMSLADNVPLRTVKDYEDYIARLNEAPRFFAENITNMQTGIAEGFIAPRVIVGRVIPALETQLYESAEDSSYFAPFNDFPGTFGDDAKARLSAAGKTVIEESVLPAFRDLYDFFVDEYEPASRDSIGISDAPGGGEYYAALVKNYTTLDITPDEIHQIGLDEVLRIRSEMEAIIDRLGFEGSFAEFLEFLRTDPQFYAQTPRQLLAEASYHAKRIDGQMPKFFGNLPRLSYGVRAVPDDIAPAYTTGRYWGGSLKNGIAGNYMVNTYALDKRPLYTLPALTLHEGVPGHHHQISLTQEMEGVPEFRKNMYLSAFGEGWGLYTEKLGVEMGIYEDDYQNFGRLTYEMWRAGRLVVDTGIHWRGWSREDAVALFVENSALSTHNINTEVDRYISWPGQALSYKMGELKIWELRRRAEEALGVDFDIRDFHDAILANGSIPLSLLEKKIDEFIAENQIQNQTQGE